MSGPKPLTGTCAGCGAENSIYHPGWSDYYCHKCAQGMHNYELAREHLVDLVDPVLDVWRTHWLASGVTHKDLVEAVKYIEPDLLRVLRELNEEDPKPDTTATP